MFGRGWLFAAVLVGTAVVPYLLSNSSGVTGLVASALPSGSVDEEEPAPESPPANETSQAPAAPQPVKPLGPHETPVWPMQDVFRFDVTNAWVLARWPRVSASLADLDLQGYRVPLVTGTTEADVAGSLTYYFNREQRVQRITFQGTAGDTRRFVALMEQRHDFHRQTTDDPRLFLYQVKHWGKPTSELRIRPAEIVRSNDPHARFEIALNLLRPKGLD